MLTLYLEMTPHGWKAINHVPAQGVYYVQWKKGDAYASGIPDHTGTSAVSDVVSVVEGRTTAPRDSRPVLLDAGGRERRVGVYRGRAGDAV